MRLSLLLNPGNIYGAPYVQHYEKFSMVGICARVWINRASSALENEMITVSAPRNDYIIIQANLEDPFGITNILDNRSIHWGVDIFRCNDRNQEIISPADLRNGEKLRLCIVPTTKTRNDGIYLGVIKSLNFVRDDILQKSVATYGTDDSTDVECQRGSDLCVIETVLSNSFFYSPGEVEAQGVFLLQYGNEEKRKQRSLRSFQVDLKSSSIVRSLYDYEKGEIVGERVADYTVTIKPMNKRYSAEAFPCDSSNKEVKQSSLNEGDDIQLCIEPDEEARDAGVYINTLESFSFGRANDDRVQLVIDSYGRIEDDSRTIVDCSQGASVCAIKSSLEEWFYDDDTRMVVTGYVVLQFGNNNERRRASLSYRKLDESSGSDLGFAGRSEVNAYFDTVRRNSETTDDDNWFEKLFDRWDLNDTHMTVMYVVAAVLVALICLCCCGGGLFLVYMMTKKRNERPVRNSQIPINIKIENPQDYSNSTDNRKSHSGSRSSGDDNDSESISEDSENFSEEILAPESSNLVTRESVSKTKKRKKKKSKDDEDNSNIPRKNDVCFDAEDHPGTEAFVAAVQQTLESLGSIPYSPTVYKNIKRQLSSRRFYVCDQDNDRNTDQYEWREASKRELIDIFWKYYEEEKSRIARDASLK